MSYLARLKQLNSSEKFTHSPETEPTELPKAPSVSFVSTVRGRIENIAANDPAMTSHGWLIHYADREPVECYICPVVTHAELLKLKPDAIRAEALPGLPVIPDPPE